MSESNVPVDPWETWDLQQAQTGPAPRPRGPLRVALYGRCSTEDLQDPETSRRWQFDRAMTLLRQVDPTAEIVAVFFDIGFSRSLPWKRRPEALRLLEEIDSPDRGWDAIVVGEGKRCFYGSQFVELAPILADRGIDLYVPELSGRYDSRNAAHYTLMTVTGGMSLSERQSVMERVRASMKVQTEGEGRFLGGRPPYGYRLEAYAPHPNPNKARHGLMLQRLVIDPEAAVVVQRIFAEVIAGKPVTQIAAGLNHDGIPSPSVHDPSLNHRSAAEAWRSGTVKSIAENIKFTGFMAWGRTTRTEVLLDPSDASWGMRVKKVLSTDPIVRSRVPSHEAIVDVATWQQAQRVLRATGVVPQRQRAAAPRARSTAKAPYALRGVITCAMCGRLMSGEKYKTRPKPTKRPRADGGVRPGPVPGNVLPDHLRPERVRYACKRRTEQAEAPRFAGHPASISLAESIVLPLVSDWLAEIFSPRHREATIEVLTAALDVRDLTVTRANRHGDRLAAAKAKLDRLLDLVEDGAVDMESVKPRIDRAQAEVRTLLEGAPAESHQNSVRAAPTPVRLNAMLDSLADVAGEVFGEEADPLALNAFLTAIGMRLDWDLNSRVLTGEVLGAMPRDPRAARVGVSASAEGGSRTRTPWGTAS